MAGTSLEKDPSGHGDVVPVAHAEPVLYNPDAPSEEWGWHGHWSDFAPRGRFILLAVGVVGLLLMIIGNHQSHVEDWWLAGIAAALAVWMAYGYRERARARRRRP
ncbi:DUF2631 domain-containing protein [Nakamurella endophytica]|uniref:DUF2631 domain-containing protein n=1 Tax=Nakamurella endophytica TaxID=1748367 RepID=A0A917SSM0_9ACTN|nr:DUF2631 domain-containing protein [Nakamurella endophytica]GGL95653.1 hypothetical protein GCM10011594_14160 [Nakamurella endophytica]